jgi:hypothetical protein
MFRFKLCAAVVSAAFLLAPRAEASGVECVSGVYPHLAMFNGEGE